MSFRQQFSVFRNLTGLVVLKIAEVSKVAHQRNANEED
jgi:hypothetical protein